MRSLPMILLGMAILMAVFVVMARGGDTARAEVVDCTVFVDSMDGLEVTVNLLATGPGLESAPALTFNVDWGDTTSETFTGMPGGPDAQEVFPPPHTYPAPGMFKITLTVDGCMTMVTKTVGAVGGIAEVRVGGSDSPATPTDGSGSSAGLYAAIAGSIAAVVAVSAGGWYARRRFAHRRIRS